MADELTLDAQISFAKNGVSMAGGPYHATVDVAGDNFIQNTVILDPANNTILPFGDIDVPGYVLLNAVRVVPAPDAPTSLEIANEGTPGAVTYTYKVVTVGLGTFISSAASEAITTATGNASLSGTDFNRLTWPAVTDAESYTVYRTVGGATQGIIGTASSTTDTVTFDDTGLAGGGETAPSTASIIGDSALSIATFDNDTINQNLTLKLGEFALFRLNGTEINANCYDFPVVVEYTVFEN